MPLKYTEGMYDFEFLVGERCSKSIDKVTIAAGQNLVVGAVIAKTFVGTAAGANKAGNTGNPTIGAITVGKNAEAGDYTVYFTAATGFQVYSPSGKFLGTGATGTAFTAAYQVGFTLTAGGNAAVAGDVFLVTVTEGVSTWAAATGTDAAGILGVATDASAGAVSSLAVVRLSEYNENEVNFGTMDAAHIVAAKAALTRRYVIARSGI